MLAEGVREAKLREEKNSMSFMSELEACLMTIWHYLTK